MADKWPETPLADLTEPDTPVTYGVVKPGDEDPNGVLFIRGGDIANGRVLTSQLRTISKEVSNQYKRTLLRGGELVMSLVGNPGQVAIVPASLRGANIARQAALIRLRRDVDSRFVMYFLSSRFGQEALGAHSRGSVQQVINLRELKTVCVPTPPLSEQRAIAHILGTLDDKIELNRRMSETLEAMARALFQSWFVDFDPVRAKAEGRDPGLPQPLADLFPDSFVDSELGEIPRGWEVKKLSDLCSTQYGYTASAVDEPVGPKFLRVTDINKRNWIDWGDVPHCEIEPDTRASYALHLGDVVVARMADPGKSAIIEEYIDAVFASYLVRLKTLSLAHSYFVYGFLKSDLYAEYAEGTKSGSVQANMNAKVIVGASLTVPPKAVLDAFLRAVLPLRQRLVANVRESRTLAALRDALLPKLISGELRVKDAEAFLKERAL